MRTAQEFALFQQTAAHVQQRRLWVLTAQNLNFAPKFPQNKAFQSQILHFWKQIFRQKENFATAQNLRGQLPSPSATTPLGIAEFTLLEQLYSTHKWITNAMTA